MQGNFLDDLKLSDISIFAKPDLFQAFHVIDQACLVVDRSRDDHIVNKIAHYPGFDLKFFEIAFE